MNPINCDEILHNIQIYNMSNNKYFGYLFVYVFIITFKIYTYYYLFEW